MKNEGIRSIPLFILAFVLAFMMDAPNARSEDFNGPAELEAVLSDEDMDLNRGSRGMTTNTISTVTSNQTLTSTSTGNVMYVEGNLTNGAIAVGDNFGGSGIGSFVMNTGNNSVINSGVSLSVFMLQQ
jgi:hypothetical protein